jgi:nicotinamidase-related amidase
MLMRADQSVLLIVDVQERLIPVMHDPRSVIYNCLRLLSGAARLAVPYLVTEQYPKGIGPTVADIRQAIEPEALFVKNHFSCVAEPGFLPRLAAHGRKQIVMAGIEAHVCVNQTALDLNTAGYEVFVVAEACSSRKAEHANEAFERMKGAGITIVNVEMVIFEWLHRAGTPEFKELMGIVK